MNQLAIDDKVDAGVGLGSSYITAHIRRVSGQPCQILDVVTGFSGVTATGRRVDVQLPMHVVRDELPVRLEGTKDTAQIRYSYGNVCGSGDQQTFPERGVSHIHAQLRRVGDVAFPSSFTDGFGCDPAKDLLVDVVGATPPEPTFAASPLDGLTARLDAPASVRAGQTLRYTVTLTNPTDADIVLDPCPNFDEFLKGVNERLQSHALNCADAHPVPAHESEAFAMELVVAPDAQSGGVTLSWWLRLGSVFVGNHADVQVS